MNDQDLVEGGDYYLEDGLMIFTARYLRRRGYCCEHGCRHCPYGYTATKQEEPDVGVAGLTRIGN